MLKACFRDRFVVLGLAGVLTPAVLVIGLFGFAARIDAQAREREEQIVRHGFNTVVEEVAHVAVGQSIWDEAAAHLAPLDPVWARFNIRDFFIQSSGFEFAAVVAPADTIAFANHDGEETGPGVDAFNASIAPLVARIRTRESGLAPLSDRVSSGNVLKDPVQESNLVRIGDQFYSVTATLVQPDKTPSLVVGRAPIVVVGEEINSGFLAKLSQKYLLGDVAILPQPTSASKKASVTFVDADDHPVLTLAWAPQTPGRTLLWTAAPLLALVVVSLGGLAFFFDDRSRRAITQLIASEKRASHLAHHDPLTGLPNRAMAAQRLAQAIDLLRRNGRTFAVHCLDVDRFKDVNDTFGHQVGDELICRVAGLLTQACRAGDTVVRLGGDEFAVIQEDCTPAKAADLADRLVALMAQPFDLTVGKVYVGASIGVSMVTSDTARDPQECLREADLALYRAKDRGRGCSCFFEPDMDVALRNRRDLQNDLRDALKNNQLTMVYQPQVDVRDQVTGVEGLMRWSHPVRGAVSPAVFIPLAEECGLIEQLGWFAMRRAFQDGARWPHIKIGINVSASQLRLKNFIAQVKVLVSEYEIDPRRFEFEITEGLLLADTPETHATLIAIRDLGFQIALDDFGTGYSSLSYLKKFPITRIKIDRSFVSTLGVDEESEDVISAIVRLARALKMAVVAEGVETGEQRKRLTAAGCRDIQGFFASKPLGVDQVQAFIDGFSGQQGSDAA